LRELTKVYGSRIVLRRISLDIAAGEFVALLGKSGSGKTTLLRILSGLEEASGGSADVAVEHSVVFQEPRLIPNKRVWRNVVIGQRDRGAKGRAHDVLQEVGLADKARSWPGVLSGGEAQRVGVARALSRGPGLLLLDEPFAALDALTRLEVQALTLRLREQHGFAALLVTHDVDEAVALADRVLLLRDGHIVLDERLSSPERRDRAGEEFERVRLQLLRELGVDARAEGIAGR